ncbi:hypothetical protein IT407_00565 [Candidatus Uhrbacteria bacterium]|nr:hypothetical protein [Candidatus Uhrbacteria bacterium]
MGGESKFSTYTHSEGRTALGTAVEFTCRPEDKEAVSKFLETKVRSIGLPLTRTLVSHGSYGQPSRYNIKQHKYGAGQSEDSDAYRYVEVLEIMQPPDERWPIVINDRSNNGGFFSEWETLEQARKAYDKVWKCHEERSYFGPIKDRWERIRSLPGFKRIVECGAMEPWFYAVGEEVLVGDYAFPHGLQDDPVFRFGAKFAVRTRTEGWRIKTCMGARYFEKESDYHPYKKERKRFVYWDDGTRWEEGDGSPTPRPAEEGELWIAEAMEQFRRLLSGPQTHFEIAFANGMTFKGQLVDGEKGNLGSPEGKYEITVFRKDKEPVRTEGTFKSTENCPMVHDWVKKELVRQEFDYTSFEVKLIKAEEHGQHWSGVFLDPPMNKKL